MASIIIIFGSTSGNTELVSEKVKEVLESRSHKVKLQRGELSEVKDIKPSDLCILAASTYGHGIIQEHMIPFLHSLKTQDFKAKKFAIIGLGDYKYDRYYNVESAHILEKAVQECGGELVIDSLHINKSPVPQLDTKVAEWAKKLAKKA